MSRVLQISIKDVVAVLKENFMEASVSPKVNLDSEEPDISFLVEFPSEKKTIGKIRASEMEQREIPLDQAMTLVKTYLHSHGEGVFSRYEVRGTIGREQIKIYFDS